MIFTFGINPRNLSLVKLSRLDNLSDWAQLIDQRLAQEIQQSSMILLGAWPQSKISEDLVQAIQTDLQSKSWDPKNGFQEGANFSLQDDWQALKSKVESNLFTEKILVQSWLPWTHAALKENPAAWIQDVDVQNKVLFISIAPLNDKESVQCDTQSQDHAGFARLGCEIQQKSKFYARKIRAAGFWGVLEQTGKNDYLILIQEVGKF